MDHSFLQNKVSKERVQRSGSDRITARLSMKRRRTVEKKKNLNYQLLVSSRGGKKIHFEGSRGPSVAAGPGVAYPPDPPLNGPASTGHSLEPIALSRPPTGIGKKSGMGMGKKK